MGLPGLKSAPEGISARQFFSEWLPEQIKPFADVIKKFGGGVSADFSFRIEGEGGGEWSVSLNSGDLKIEDGIRQNAVLTLIMSETDFTDVVTGKRMMAGMGMPDGKGGGADSDLEELPGRLKDTINTLKSIEGMLRFKILGEDKGDFIVSLNFAGPIKDNPDVTVSMTASEAEAMARGESNPQAAFMAGKIKIDGDIGLLMQMAPLMM